MSCSRRCSAEAPLHHSGECLPVPGLRQLRKKHRRDCCLRIPPQRRRSLQRKGTPPARVMTTAKTSFSSRCCRLGAITGTVPAPNQPGRPRGTQSLCCERHKVTRSAAVSLSASLESAALDRNPPRPSRSLLILKSSIPFLYDAVPRLHRCHRRSTR